MVTQYPYKLEILVIVGSEQDDNGDYHTQKTYWKYYCNCRDDAGNGKIIKSIDGINYTYTALIQCPKYTTQIASGTIVRVIGVNGDIRVPELPVVNSRMDQLHTRIWV